MIEAIMISIEAIMISNSCSNGNYIRYGREFIQPSKRHAQEKVKILWCKISKTKKRLFFQIISLPWVCYQNQGFGNRISPVCNEWIRCCVSLRRTCSNFVIRLNRANFGLSYAHFELHHPTSPTSTTIFRMGLLGSAHGWVGMRKGPPYLKSVIRIS